MKDFSNHTIIYDLEEYRFCRVATSIHIFINPFVITGLHLSTLNNLRLKVTLSCDFKRLFILGIIS